jgi:hypothetical protein
MYLKLDASLLGGLSAHMWTVQTISTCEDFAGSSHATLPMPTHQRATRKRYMYSQKSLLMRYPRKYSRRVSSKVVFDSGRPAVELCRMMPPFGATAVKALKLPLSRRDAEYARYSWSCERGGLPDSSRGAIPCGPIAEGEAAIISTSYFHDTREGAFFTPL